MAPRSVYQKYKDAANKAGVRRNSKESVDWFRARIRKDKRITDLYTVTQGIPKRARIKPGSLVTYEYDPKYKKKLPYYDRFPLVMILDFHTKGWSGMNLHYLSPRARADLLADVNERKTSGTALARRFGNSPYYRASYKKYLSSHAKGSPIEIPKEEWEIAIQLPYENFRGATNKQVWKR